MPCFVCLILPSRFTLHRYMALINGSMKGVPALSPLPLVWTGEMGNKRSGT